MKPETAFSKRLVTLGRRLGVFVTRHEDLATPGVPDISWSYGGRSGWIETKSESGRLEPEQYIFLLAAGAKNGDRVAVVRPREMWIGVGAIALLHRRGAPGEPIEVGENPWGRILGGLLSGEKGVNCR